MDTATFKTKNGERPLTRDEILEGMMRFDQDWRGKVPDTGNGWFIQEKDKKYPPKYAVWLGTGIPRGEFKSGGRLNNALRSLGFDVREVEEDLSEEPDAEEAEEIETTTFSIERDLQNALRKHIEQLELGLHITDSGKEQVVASGRIDITAKDKKGATVVIELKAGEADHHAIGQILAYMGELTADKDVTRGILVAGGFSQKALAAVRVVKNLQLKKYGFNFTFEDAGKS
jgi:hypothetical protein